MSRFDALQVFFVKFECIWPSRLYSVCESSFAHLCIAIKIERRIMTVLFILITLEIYLFEKFKLYSYKQIKLLENFYKKCILKTIFYRLKRLVKRLKMIIFPLNSNLAKILVIIISNKGKSLKKL